ncbi:MAG: AmmeMemoRadiSam system radical SAM enzyme [Planctomycetota bacterium]
MIPIQKLLGEMTAAGRLVRPEGDKLRCLACAHRCLLGPGREGICKVRFRDAQGAFKIPWGYVGGVQVDPIEKKPFYHVYPGHDALSFGMLGCDMKCGYCQNWVSSQVLRDPNATAGFQKTTPEDLINTAKRQHAPVMVSTYNEPLITAEWSAHIFRKAQAAGILCGFVSNGNATREVLEFIQPVVSLYKVDLKSFNKKNYAQLGASRDNVLNTIRWLKELGFWLEVLTLMIEGFNATEDEMKGIAEFLVSVDPFIPWHVTAFHPDYKMMENPPTSPQTLIRAAEIGYAAGLKFVYAGNLPGQVGEFENTRCPNCYKTLIERRSFHVLQNRIREGRCPDCKAAIPGMWNDRVPVGGSAGRPRAIRV